LSNLQETEKCLCNIYNISLLISFDAVVPLTVKDESIEVAAKIVRGLLHCACHSADSFGRLGLPRAKAACRGSLGGSPSRLEDAVLRHVDM